MRAVAKCTDRIKYKNPEKNTDKNKKIIRKLIWNFVIQQFY